MLGRYKIYVVTSGFLQLQHHCRHLPGCYFLSCFFLTDIEVLTKYTAEIAPAKEYGAASVPPSQWILLAEMLEKTGNSCVPARAANFSLILYPVYTAVPRADFALFQALESFIYSSLQLAGFIKFEIIRFVHD